MTDSEKKDFLAKLIEEDLNGYIIRSLLVFSLMLFCGIMLHAGDKQMKSLFFALCALMLLDISQYGITKPTSWCNYSNLSSKSWERIKVAVLGPQFSSSGLWLVSFLVVVTGILILLYAIPPVPFLGWAMVFAGILIVPYARRQVRKFDSILKIKGNRIDIITRAQDRIIKLVPVLTNIYTFLSIVFIIKINMVFIFAIPIFSYFYYIGRKTAKTVDNIKPTLE